MSAPEELSHAWKSGYAQAKEEAKMERDFCPHCNPCPHDGGDKCRAPEPESAASNALADEAALDAMVNRFLSWPLPKYFRPDCGISFDGREDDEWNKNKTWPVGTNLFTADQARDMLRHVLGRNQPGGAVPRFAQTWCSQCGQSQGPGDSGYSHCSDHATTKVGDE